ncbi:MAG TPA: glycosyltransferase family 4 protein [Chloroflexia bacterium]|nr:glycosyltransferase family 4 protein [Chloroflexia bacterium]
MTADDGRRTTDARMWAESPSSVVRRPSSRSLHIAICTAQVPFVYGGNEVLVEGLREALVSRGHSVAVIALPYKWYPHSQIVSSALAWRLLDITEADGQEIDLAICTKWPSYVVRHPRKVVWLVHQFRQIYDWFGTPMSDFTGTPEDVRIRRTLMEMDRKALAESKRIFTISRNVASRLKRFNGLEGTPLYPPLRSGLNLEPGPYGDYILSVNRLDAAKRISLLLDALANAPGARAVIAGTGPEAANLKRKAGELGMADRVEFTGFASDDDVSRLYANARAVYYAPIDEDYGYGTIEGMTAARPIITTTDAGGVLEFVDDGQTGLVAPPDAKALGTAITRLMNDPGEAARMGSAGKARVAGIDWDGVVDALLKGGM